MNRSHTYLRNWLILLVIGVGVLVSACQGLGGGPSVTLRIVSGSENKTLESIIQDWGKSNGTEVDITYLGSLDIARLLQSGSVPYDAVWPANHLWLDFGDTHNLVKQTQSILRSPVVLGVKRSVAQRLGWIGTDVYMNDILNAAEAGDLRFMMTSATQSNSGASFYMGALHAFAGSPTVLTSADLENPDVADKITRILGTVDRSAGSSGWLKDLFLQQYDRYDAMVNYEAVVIEADQALESSGREPLYAVYPVDGLTIADSPLAFIDHGDQAVTDKFQALQTYLLSEPVQRQLLALGRRTSILGIDVSGADPNVFRSAWGIDTTRVLQPVPLPSRDVIQEALNLYQTAFRKASCTAYVLDFSGSMAQSTGEADLKTAMRTLLDQDVAAQYLLQASPKDFNMVILFNQNIINADELDRWTVHGNNPDDLRHLSRQIEAVHANGNTNIFDSTRLALQQLNNQRTSDCLPAVILMTDGQDNSGDINALNRTIQQSENDIPVFAIMFGNADSSQLEPIVNATYGRIFDGRTDLVTAFREAKGYN